MSEYISRPASFSINVRKVRDYLLNPESRDGRGKTGFFERLGHRCCDPDSLIQRLHHHTDLGNFVGIKFVPRGHELIFESVVRTDDGAAFRLRSIWQVDAGGDGVARLITAHPVASR